MENIQLQQPLGVIAFFANPFGPEKRCTGKMICAGVRELWADGVYNCQLNFRYFSK